MLAARTIAVGTGHPPGGGRLKFLTSIPADGAALDQFRPVEPDGALHEGVVVRRSSAPHGAGEPQVQQFIGLRQRGVLRSEVWRAGDPHSPPRHWARRRHTLTAWSNVLLASSTPLLARTVKSSGHPDKLFCKNDTYNPTTLARADVREAHHTERARHAERGTRDTGGPGSERRVRLAHSASRKFDARIRRRLSPPDHHAAAAQRVPHLANAVHAVVVAVRFLIYRQQERPTTSSGMPVVSGTRSTYSARS